MNNKSDLRKLFSSVRNGLSLSEKFEYDRRVFSNFINSSIFRDFEIFLVYISFKNEAKTTDLIKYLLEHSGKKVTVRLERGADIDAACGQLRGKSN